MLLHYVGCIKLGWTSKTTLIDCLVDAGADLASQDSEGLTPLMAYLYKGRALEENIKCLIHHSEGTPALEAEDNEGYSVLNLAASIKENCFTKKINKVMIFSVLTHFNFYFISAPLESWCRCKSCQP